MEIQLETKNTKHWLASTATVGSTILMRQPRIYLWEGKARTTVALALPVSMAWILSALVVTPGLEGIE